MASPQVGDYVLATKYNEGHCGDHWVVGYVHEITDDGKFKISDHRRVPMRASGFARAKTISESEGREMISLSPLINDSIGNTVWQHLSRVRKRLKSS